MSPREIEDFVKRWPALERRLHRALFAMRVPDAVRDDVVQESAIRLMGMWQRLDPALPVWPLLRTIAVRIVADEARKKRELPTDVVPDTATSDAATTAFARLEAADMWEAVARLTPKERAAILSGLTPSEPGGRESSATKMARLRARRRLSAFLEQAGWGLAHAGALLRRPWLRAVSRWNGSSLEAALRDLLPAGIAALHVVVGAGLVLQSTPPPPSPERVVLVEPSSHAAPARREAAPARTALPRERRAAHAVDEQRGAVTELPVPTATAEPRPHPAGEAEGGASAHALGRGASVEDREKGIIVTVCTGDVSSPSSEPCTWRREDATTVWVGHP